MRRITKTFQTVTPESAEQGDFADSGWIDEVGTEIAPDDLDLEEYDDDELRAVVSLAVNEITSEGGVEPSSSRWHSGVWYTSIDPDRDYSDGSETTYSYHLDGFSEAEEQAIFAELKR